MGDRITPKVGSTDISLGRGGEVMTDTSAPGTRRIAILGGGPIGLEAALLARSLGHSVKVFESSPRVAGNMRSWGHVRLFTPWPMNVSRLGSRRIREEGLAAHEWPASKCPTGVELVDHYLDPLSRLPEMEGVLSTGTRVVALGRSGLLKGDAIPATGDHRRDGRPFVLLLRSSRDSGPGIEERYEEADVVLDATGIYGQPNPLGRSGMLAPGEESARDHLLYGVPDVASFERERVSGKDVLIIGGGHSAATTVCALAEAGARSVVWVTRAPTPPITEIPDDPLPSRIGLAKKANALALDPSSFVDHIGQSEVASITRNGGRTVVQVAQLSSAMHVRSFEVDTVIVQTGFRPDNSLYRELQVHECYASQGPMNLASALLGASDCMTQSGHGPDSLKNPEPDFFVIGNKSYGRNSSFLLRIGREQVRDVFRLLSGNPDLDFG